MLATPSTSHVSYDTIYEPAEDSFLLLDALSANSEIDWLKSRFGNSKTRSPLVVEIGTGSGVVIAFTAAHAQSIFSRGDVITLGIDVNENACKATRETVLTAIKDYSVPKHQSSYLGSVRCDLGQNILPHSVDVLIFNPPYVPTDELPDILGRTEGRSKFEESSHLLALSYAGGKDGMETTQRLLQQLPQLLSPHGVAYVLLCAANKPDEVKTSIRVRGDGWEAETVRRSGKQAGWEKLEILRIWRTSNS